MKRLIFLLLASSLIACDKLNTEPVIDVNPVEESSFDPLMPSLTEGAGSGETPKVTVKLRPGHLNDNFYVCHTCLYRADDTFGIFKNNLISAAAPVYIPDNGNPMSAAYTSLSSRVDTPNEMSENGLLASGDLNSREGVGATLVDEVLACFTPLKYHLSNGIWMCYNEDFELKQEITGLILVSIPAKLNPEKSIPSSLTLDGCTYHPCDNYYTIASSLSYLYYDHFFVDLNDDAGGDYLYLYQTTDYTGRKLYFQHPDGNYNASLLESDNELDWDFAHIRTLPCSWHCDNDHQISELLSLRSPLYEEQGINKTLADYVCFVMGYNYDGSKLTLMDNNPLNPGDFNRGAGGDYVFLSVPYKNVAR